MIWAEYWLWHPFIFLFLQGSREQLAIAEFARSLLIIPKTLAVNAAQDSTDLVAKLRAFHNEAQVNPERKNLKWWVFPYSSSHETKVPVNKVAQQIYLTILKGFVLEMMLPFLAVLP